MALALCTVTCEGYAFLTYGCTQLYRTSEQTKILLDTNERVRLTDFANQTDMEAAENRPTPSTLR